MSRDGRESARSAMAPLGIPGYHGGVSAAPLEDTIDPGYQRDPLATPEQRLADFPEGWPPPEQLRPDWLPSMRQHVPGFPGGMRWNLAMVLVALRWHRRSPSAGDG